MKESLSFDFLKTRQGFELKARGSFKPGVNALYGPSGAGKTTLLNLVAGIEDPDEGTLKFGESWFFNSIRGINLPPEGRKIGYVFQDDALFPHLNVLENLNYGARRGKNGDQFGKLTVAFGLEKLLDRAPASLSGGEKKRVAIARALLSAPDILLLDEPLASIDARRRDAFFPYLEVIRQEFAMPVVYVSHQLDDVIRLADYMVYMVDGRVEEQGTLADVFGSTAFQAGLGLDQRGTLLEGKIKGVENGLARIDVGGAEILSGDKRLRKGHKARIRLLAKDVALSLQKPKDISILNVLPCRVVKIGKTFTGHIEVELEIEQIAGKKTLILAEITRRSAVQLKLKKGLSLYALIKALAIISPGI